MFAYYFRSDSGDEYLDISEKDMNVTEAMLYFNWDDPYGWMSQGYDVWDIPYASFIKTKWKGR